MAADPSDPHDALFRKLLDNPADAASELRVALPKDIAARVSWGTLRRQSGTFVNKALRSRYTDLLFRARLRGSGRTALIDLLMEHQSRPGPLMAFWLLDSGPKPRRSS
jgi:predicted transposase YdaD